MYYAHFILNKKGPLAKIWLAAHWDKKLTKAQIYETNIESTIETILEPQMKLALRTSGHLLLGVCRIYSRKVKYLLADCNEAFVKIKLAFRPGLIDMPKEKQQASVDAITLPEKFPEFFVNFEDINMEDMDLTKNINTQQARIEDITLKEDFGTFVATQDDDFGDMGSFGMDMDTFMMGDLERGRQLENGSMLGGNGLDFFDDQSNNQSNFANSKDIQPMDLNDLNNDLNANGGLMDSTVGNQINSFNDELDQPSKNLGELGDTLDMPDIDDNTVEMTNPIEGVVPNLFEDHTVNQGEEEKKADNENSPENKENSPEKENETGDIELAPVNLPSTTVVVEKQNRTKRRIRKLIIDDIKEIDSSSMKTQLSDTTNIIGQLELAPPTRRLMLLKETSGVDKMFSLTSRPLHNKTLLKLYTKNMFTRSLVDITNSNTTISNNKTINKSVKENHLESTKLNSESLINNESLIMNNDASIEGSVNGGEISKSGLLGGESLANFSKQNELSLQLNDELDEFDKFGGPGSVFNNTNVDDMLAMGDMPTNGLDETPANLISDIEKKLDEESDNSQSEEEDEAGVKKSTTKSPNRKRSYRKSMNATITNIDETAADESTLDPSKSLTKRAKTMVSILNKCFKQNDNVGFFELSRKNVRKHAAQKFYSLLVLKKYDIIDVMQADTYGDIIINKGDKFDNHTPN